MNTKNSKCLHRTGSQCGRLQRNGAVVVEAALIIPILLVLSLGAIDIAQYINLAQKVTSASREGSRVASRNRTTSVSEVEDSIKSHLAEFYPQLTSAELDQACVVEIRHGDDQSEISGGDLTTVPPGDSLSIRISFQFTAIRWLSGPAYWHGNVNELTTHARRE